VHDLSTGKNAKTLSISDRIVATLLDRIAERKGDNIVSFLASTTDFLVIQSADGYPRLLPFRFWNSWHWKQWDSFCSRRIFYPHELDADIWKFGSRKAQIPAAFVQTRLQSHILLAACAARDGWRSSGTRVSLRPH